jgi:hypothetical protein
MIKKILISGIILILCFHVKALEFGLKLGISKANFSFSPKPDQLGFENISDKLIGGFMRLNISKCLSLQPEVYYTFKGSIHNERYSSSVTDYFRYKFEITYIDIPVLLNYHIPVRGKVRPIVYLGTYLDLCQKAKFLKIIDHGKNEQFGEREDIEKYITDTDFGLVFGGGVEINLCFGKILIDFRYSRGFTELTENINELSYLIQKNGIIYNQELADDFININSLKNKTFTFMIGFAF